MRFRALVGISFAS